eukprot:m.67912 g.67912  ORF g.67912 m.67912 type:complete len:84 (+) comp35479_c0_seq1:194-445(+)
MHFLTVCSFSLSDSCKSKMTTDGQLTIVYFRLSAISASRTVTNHATATEDCVLLEERPFYPVRHGRLFSTNCAAVLSATRAFI